MIKCLSGVLLDRDYSYFFLNNLQRIEHFLKLTNEKCPEELRNISHCLMQGFSFYKISQLEMILANEQSMENFQLLCTSYPIKKGNCSLSDYIDHQPKGFKKLFQLPIDLLRDYFSNSEKKKNFFSDLFYRLNSEESVDKITAWLKEEVKEIKKNTNCN